MGQAGDRARVVMILGLVQWGYLEERRSPAERSSR